MRMNIAKNKEDTYVSEWNLKIIAKTVGFFEPGNMFFEF